MPIKLTLLLIIIFTVTTILVTWPGNLTSPNYKADTIIPTGTQIPATTPTIPKKETYYSLILGDSMEDALGPNANPLREKLIEYYPENEFVNYNYGFGSTNILSLKDRLNALTNYRGESYPPALTLDFDLVLFGSFAYNPLSEFPLEEGLKKQNEALDENIKKIREARPRAVIVFLTPIAPSKEKYGEGVVEMTRAERRQNAEERIAYIKNHIEYANKNSYPVIDIYEKSLKGNGEVDLKYINPDDYIHPSAEGLDMMARTIADFIYENEIYPR